MKLSTLALFLFLFFSFCLSAQLAPDFTISATDGQDHQLYTDYLNQDKTVVLKIMFVNCPPCNAIAPSLEILYQEWGGGAADVEFFSLSILSIDNNVDVLGYETLHNLTFPGAGSDGGAAAALMPYTSGTFGGFFGTPTFAVIAPDKTVQWNPSGSGFAATLDSLDVAIAATGAIKPNNQAPLSIAGSIETESGESVNAVTVNYTNDGESQMLQTVLDGQFQFGPIAHGSHPQIQPSKNTDADNGVNLLDVFLIQKHILSIDTIDSPYKLIAADANASNTVNLSDVFQLQRLILNIDTSFSNTNSWRFIDAAHSFPDWLHPVVDPSIEMIQYDNIMEDQLATDFVAIKIGDVNGNANTSNLNEQTDTRSTETLIFTVANQQFVSGQTYQIAFKAPNLHHFTGFQFSLQFDPDAIEFKNLSFTDRSDELGLGMNNFGYNNIENGVLTALWTTLESVSSDPESVIFVMEIEALSTIEAQQAFTINSAITEALAIYQDGTEADIVLDFTAITATQSPTLSSFTIYPNPATQQISIASTKVNDGQHQIRLYNSLGQLIKTDRFRLPHNSSAVPISTRGVKPGAYALEIWNTSTLVYQTQLVITQ